MFGTLPGIRIPHNKCASFFVWRICINDALLACHPERSEASRTLGSQMLSAAKHDNTDLGC